MRRFLSVWLPRWPIEHRFRISGNPLLPASGNPTWGQQNIVSAPVVELGQRAPFALITSGERGINITATNLAAEQAGVYAGLSFTDARALCPDLVTADAEPDQDLDALNRLTLWCHRYSPLVTLHAPDGLALDITGCAHLFGGEKGMIQEISRRLAGFGLTNRLALADSIGAAWAVARHGRDPISLVKEGENIPTLSPLPLAALRLDPALILRLKQLGLRKISHLLNAPKAPLVSRFGPALTRRLHQAIGDEAEIFGPLFPPPVYQVRHPFEEPVLHLTALDAALDVLAKKMEEALKGDQKGARSLDVQIFRVDGHIEKLSIGTSRLCQQADHITLLFRETLSRLHEDLDTGFGIDLMTMAAYGVERLEEQQNALPEAGETTEFKIPQPTSSQDMDQLLDRFGNRFGFDRVTRFLPAESYIPEKAFQAVPVNITEKRPPWLEIHRKTPLRPFLLFHPPEPITVLAEVPDGPPLRFEWRRLHHHITCAEGPERLAPEWWDVGGDDRSRQTRDYYRVENTSGHRFWLYRDGLYDREADIPRWYMQGIFP